MDARGDLVGPIPLAATANICLPALRASGVVERGDSAELSGFALQVHVATLTSHCAFYAFQRFKGPWGRHVCSNQKEKIRKAPAERHVLISETLKERDTPARTVGPGLLTDNPVGVQNFEPLRNCNKPRCVRSALGWGRFRKSRTHLSVGARCNVPVHSIRHLTLEREAESAHPLDTETAVCRCSRMLPVSLPTTVR